MPLPPAEMSRLLAVVKAEINESGSQHDAELYASIEEAVDLVEDEIGPLEVTSRTELVPVSGLLRHAPVIAVTAASYLGTDVTASVVLDAEVGQVSGVYTGTRITYTYGLATLPPRVRTVLKTMVRRAWRGTQQGGVPGYGGGGEVDGGLPPAMFLSKGDRESLGSLRRSSAAIA